MMGKTHIRLNRDEHIEVVIRRRIKTIVEKGAMSRLFRKGSHRDLQEGLRERIDIDILKGMGTQGGFDEWHRRIVLHGCWGRFTNRRIKEVLWGKDKGEAFIRYCEDGDLEIDNNGAEPCL